MYAALSVTVPADTKGNVADDITVTAEGKLAKESGVVIGPTGSDVAVVTTGVIHSVQVEVLPGESEPQSGAPGSPIAWLVVVKNTGNIGEVFTLDVAEVLENVSSDCTHTEWGAALDNNSMALAAFQKSTTYLRVTVPECSKTSEWNTITVSLTGSLGGHTDPKATASYSVQAHVMEPGPMIPENVLELTTDVEVVAMACLGGHWHDFGIMPEGDMQSTAPDAFTVRNIGNVNVNIMGRGVDAQSQPGEPVATWELVTTGCDLDKYELRFDPDGTYGSVTKNLTKSLYKNLWFNVPEGEEVEYGVTISTPTIITTPARMWTRVLLAVIAS